MRQTQDIVSSVIKYREQLTDYVNILQSNAGDYMLDEFAKLRKLDIEAIKEAGIFFIDDPAEMIVPQYIDKLRDFGVIAMNNRPIYSGRYVIPIKDIKGYVMALVGYKYGTNDKYMYATTKYFNRGDAIYGLENIVDCIKDRYAVVVEGLMDRIRVKSLGVKNVIATCGADKSWDRMLMFKEIERCIFIPDRDKAGLLTNRHWRSKSTLRLLIPAPFKDIDEFARQNEVTSKYCKDLLESSINYIVNKMAEGGIEEFNVQSNIEFGR